MRRFDGHEGLAGHGHNIDHARGAHSAKYDHGPGFYADTFATLAECEAKMSDPKAVAELRDGIEQAGRETQAAQDRIRELDKDGDGQVDEGALPGVP